MTDYSKFTCRKCNHAFFYHRESKEWQLLNPRRKRNLVGCTFPGCECDAVDSSHV